MRYQYQHMKFINLESAIGFAHLVDLRIVGFSRNDTSYEKWVVIFEKDTQKDTVTIP